MGVADVYARLSPRLAGGRLAHAFTGIHARVLEATGGRVGSRFIGGDVLLVTTTGRRSGQPRTTPLFYVREGDGFVVVASNAAAPTPPAWWLNLQADPAAEVRVRGRRSRVVARRTTDEETERVWPRLQAMYAGYDHYRSIATRELPVVLLEPT